LNAVTPWPRTNPDAGATAGRRGVFRFLRWPLGVAALLAIYPALVLGTVYWKVQHSEFEGGRNGPRDAYRHTLASAILARSLFPEVVDWVTLVMEHDGHGGAARAMDAHNNRNGARIGVEAASWKELDASVLASIRQGRVNASRPDQSTWLAADTWSERLY
jgi:hypothetical protein